MIAMYSLGIVAERSGTGFVAKTMANLTFRPHRLLFDVAARDLVTVTAIEIAGQPQLLMPIDGYEWSFDLIERLNRDFLKKHGLEGKTDEEIQDWLDDRDIGMPGDNVGRIALPTMHKGDEVVIRGDYGAVAESFRPGLSLTGFAESERLS